MDRNAVLINPGDNVVVAIEALGKGDAIVGVPGVAVEVNEDIMRNHKVAIKEIAASSPVIKYGESIGVASTDIKPGDWVHTHNLTSGEDE